MAEGLVPFNSHGAPHPPTLVAEEDMVKAALAIQTKWSENWGMGAKLLGSYKQSP